VTTTISAVYENGVLRPTQPVDLAEGETVEVTLARKKPTPEEMAAAVRRIEEAKSLQELYEAVLARPDEGDPNYDFLQALNDNRAANGERPLFPPALKGITW
jgi:predicted DNA-binding antitoxin AbrB/MazE fold protein